MGLFIGKRRLRGFRVKRGVARDDERKDRPTRRTFYDFPSCSLKRFDDPEACILSHAN